MPLHPQPRSRPNKKPLRSKFSLVTFLTSAALGLALLPALGQSQSGQSNLAESTLVVILTPRGFQQKKVSVSGGRVYFSVHNRTATSDLNFQLDRSAGERLRNAAVQRGKRAWREVVELTPGQYILTVQEYPEWSVEITVRPPGAR